MTTNTEVDQPADNYRLLRCDNCGRYGWHETDRCPFPKENAHEMSSGNTAPPRGDMPLPAGAEKAGDWESPARTGHDQPSRYFTGTTRTVAARPGIDVVIAGTQYEDGTVQREVLLNRTHADYPLTLDEARALGEAILAAVNEAEADGRRDG